MQKSARELAVEPKVLSDDALKALQQFAFPQRASSSVCHWLTVMAPGQRIESVDLPPELREPALPPGARPGESGWQQVLDRELAAALTRGEKSVGDRLEREFEMTLIRRALMHTGGHRMDAAQGSAGTATR